jgi:hypothetical protein
VIQLRGTVHTRCRRGPPLPVRHAICTWTPHIYIQGRPGTLFRGKQPASKGLPRASPRACRTAGCGGVRPWLAASRRVASAAAQAARRRTTQRSSVFVYGVSQTVRCAPIIQPAQRDVLRSHRSDLLVFRARQEERQPTRGSQRSLVIPRVRELLHPSHRRYQAGDQEYRDHVIKSHDVGTIQYTEWLILIDRVQPSLIAGVV